jgi:hypothetical protein
MPFSILPIDIMKKGSKTFITPEEMVDKSLTELGITEADLEEFVRLNIGLIFPTSDENLLIVGQQVRNRSNGRADLVAVDGEGNIVLIEIKRDQQQIKSRKEPFEFQAIRYAANYATISNASHIVDQLFAPYIERHRHESVYKPQLDKGFTTTEIASRILNDFLKDNKAQGSLNRHQRIVLLASSFDSQTLSACAWLAGNGIDIRCLSIQPSVYECAYNGHKFTKYFINIEQVIPPPSLSEFYVAISTTGDVSDLPSPSTSQKKTLPRMSDLFKWGLIKRGDELYTDGHDESAATAIDDKTVKWATKQEPIEYNKWGQEVTGWSSINIYERTVHRPSMKTLDSLRREKVASIQSAKIPPSED